MGSPEEGHERLFIELYLDEDVDVLLAELLRARNYAVVTTREAGNLHALDDEQLAWATAHQRALMTHNRLDYEALAVEYYKRGRRHAGLIIAPQMSVYHLLERLLPYLEDLTAEEMDDQILYI